MTDQELYDAGRLAIENYDSYVQKLLGDGAARDNTITTLEAQIADLTPKPPRMRVGISVKDTTQLSQRTTDFGVAPEIGRVFYPGLPTDSWKDYGLPLVVSFKPPNNDVAGFIAGKYDGPVSEWLTTYSGRVAVYHEREDNIERGEFTMAQASAMDDHMRALVNKYGKARFGIILMGWTLDPRSERTVTNYIPDRTLYDWLGWDSYPGDTPSNDLPGWTATRDWYTRCRDNSFGLPWLICETGTRNKNADPADVYDQRQADWINGAVAIARDLGCRGWTYFDSTVGGDFTLKGPKAFAAMGAGIRA